MSFLIGENVCAQNIWDGRWGCIYRCRTEWETGQDKRMNEQFVNNDI